MKRILLGGAGAAITGALVVGVIGARETAPPGKTPLPVAIASPRAPGPGGVGRETPIAIENRRAGTTAWRLDSKRAGSIEGYASRTSVTLGDALDVYVRTKAPTFHALVFRMGWYGGKGGRLVQQIPTQAGDPQSGCPVIPPRLTIQCSWRRSFTLTAPQAWLSGVYLIKLVASDGSESYVPFVVREPAPRAPILFQASVTTWQAYNLWGGRNSYRGAINSPSGKVQMRNRSRAVSFDRPYAWPGSGQFLRFEYPLLFWLESKGYDVAYGTDIDLHEGLDGLDRRLVFLSVGHDEYYSTPMRGALETALAGGTSLAFVGANDIYRHIRFEPSPLGPDRIEVNYKRAKEDPVFKTDPAADTTQWREPPLKDPEQALIGAQYDRCAPHNAWVPTLKPGWLFRGTGFRPGATVPGIVGYERDRVDRRYPVPHGLVFVARSPVRCHGPNEADSTFYVAPSGAGVFDAGSIWFDCALGAGCGRSPDPTDSHTPPEPRARPDPRVERLVANLIDAMLVRRFG